jgi:DNA/RNA-binding domain of Phe-tRNA-synthetase-like protein
MRIEVNGTRLWFDVDGSALVPGAGHFTWLDAPDRYWSMLTDFIAGARPGIRCQARRLTRVSEPFAYHADVASRFPTVVGGVIHAVGLTNGPSPPDLVAAFRAEQAAALQRIGSTPLSELPSLAAWRRAFRAFGVDPTAYRSAAEALLRRLIKQGSVPSINALVDIGNLVSIRHALPVAVFDLRAVTGRTTVGFATGEESFTDLGSGARETPEPGEVIFVDDVGLVSARRWCWRQSAESASGPDTTEVLVTVEGHHDGASEDVETALADLDELLRRHARPERVDSGVVSAARPAFTARKRP